MAAPKPPRVPAYRLHKTSNRAYVRIDGRFYYLGRYGSTESRNAYAAIVHDYLAGRPIGNRRRALGTESEAAAINIRQLADRYTEYARGYYVRNGVVTAEAGMVAKALDRTVTLFGELPATGFGPLCLEQVRDAMIEEGLRRETINGSLRRIRRAFKWAAARELIPAATHHALTLVEGLKAGRSGAVESEPIAPVDDATVEATLAELPEVVADMVLLQRLTGMRPGEVCQLRPCDLTRGGDVWTYHPPSHKTEHLGRRRVVFLGPQAQAVLLKYLTRGEQMYCFRPCDSESKRRAYVHSTRKTPLSCGNKPGSNRRTAAKRAPGDSYNKDTYGRAIRRACERAGIDRWTPNQLRHTFATEVRRKHGLEVAQVLLGHASAQTTEIYAERDAAAGERVARLIG